MRRPTVTAGVRYVEITIPDGRRNVVLNTLEDEGIDYVVFDETSSREYTAVARFSLPTQAVEPVLDRLYEAGIGEDAGVVVIDAETVVSQKFTRLREQYKRGGLEGERISRQVLRTKADELTPGFPIYATMVLISAVVATAGLLLDSPAVVVGSMVIAPLIGPALATNIGVVIADDDLRSTGLVYQVVGITLVVAGSIALATAARVAGLEPAGIDIVAVAELEERVTPNVLSLAVALGAGIAGVMSLTRGFSEAIVGVMIAAALIPPAAATGIATAWGMYGAAAGAAVLVLVNLLAINLAGLLTLWIAGYRPRGLFDVPAARRQTITYAGLMTLAVLLLLVPLVSATLIDLQTTQLESDANDEVDAVLAEPAYDDLEAEEVEIELDNDYPLRSIDRVVVVVTSDDSGPVQGLTDRLYAAIAPHAAEPIVVEVQFVVAEQEGDGEARRIATASDDSGPRRLSTLTIAAPSVVQ